jgi:hypothetical protein
MPSADRFETKQFKQYKAKLTALGADVLPRVVAETINSVASFAHADSIRNVRSRFTLRNAYTERSIKYYKATPKSDWRKINAVSGSISDYMDEQETGGERRPKKGSKAPVAAKTARGGDYNKVVRKQYKAGTDLGPKQFIGTPRGRLDRPFGVYQRNSRNRYLVMIRNISRAQVEIEGKHWHRDAVEFRYRREVLTREFIRQAELELKRLGAT